MFHTILVALDGTDRDSGALVLAQQLRHPEGRLLLTTVHARFGPLPDRSGGYDYARHVAEQSLDVLAAAARQLPAGVPAARYVRADDSVAGAIDDLATASGADLIVLGSTHRRALGRRTGRATAQKLLHGAPCSVAVAARDQHERLGRPLRICVAHDGSPEADVAASRAFDIAAATHGSVRLLRAVEPIPYADAYLPSPADYAAEHDLTAHAGSDLAEVAERAPAGLPVERRILFGPAARTILEVAHGGFDLLVAGSRGYGPVRGVCAGSVSRALLADGRVPVLVTPRGTTMGAPELPDAVWVTSGR